MSLLSLLTLFLTPEHLSACSLNYGGQGDARTPSKELFESMVATSQFCVHRLVIGSSACLVLQVKLIDDQKLADLWAADQVCASLRARSSEIVI